MSEDEQNNEIVLLPVRPLVSPEQAKADWALFENLKRSLLTADDYQAIKDRQFVKKSGFRKIAVAFNLSDRIIEQVRTDREDGSFTWMLVVEVTAPNGRTCSGVGVCDSKERGFAHVEHDVFATAHTRSKNRAISDMVAGGIVSAEEMETSSVEIEADIKTDSHRPDGLVTNRVGNLKPAEEDTTKAKAVISYTIEGADAVFKVPFKSKDVFKKVIHAATGTNPEWNDSTKTWIVDAELVTHVLLEALEEAGLALEVFT